MLSVSVTHFIVHWIYLHKKFLCLCYEEFITVSVIWLLTVFQWGSAEPVSNIIYEACFRYTLIARISPLWNHVDSYLIEGRDFLLSTSPMNAIKFEATARGNFMLLNLFIVVTSSKQSTGKMHNILSKIFILRCLVDFSWICGLPQRYCISRFLSFIHINCLHYITWYFALT